MSLWCQLFKQIKHMFWVLKTPEDGCSGSALLYSVLCRPILWLYHLERTPVYHNLLHMALCVRERTHDGKTPHTSLSAISCQGDQKPWCWSPKQTKESLKWKDWLIRRKQKVMVWIKRSHRVWACHFTSQERLPSVAIGVTAVTVNMADPHRARFCGEIQWCMKWQV